MMAKVVNFDGSELQQVAVRLLWSGALTSQVSSAEGCIKTTTTNFNGPKFVLSIVCKEELRREVNVVRGSDVF